MTAADFPLPTDLVADDFGPPEHHQAHNDLHLLVNNETNVQAGTSYTLALTDFAKTVETSSGSATQITVPPNSSVAFPLGSVVDVCQIGAGTVTIVAGVGVTIRTPSTLVLRAQYSTVSLRKRATDEWVLAGDTT